MRLQTQTHPNKNDSTPLPTFSPGVIIAALQRIGENGDFDGKEHVTHCPFHDDTGKKHLYVNITNKCGVYHCFWAKCEARGSFPEFLRVRTGWNHITCSLFMRKVAAETPFAMPTQRPLPAPRSVTELQPLAFRHEYCYERGLTEETLQRWHIGYDKTKDAITFPWFDRHGKLVGIKFRPFASGRYLCEKNVEISSLVYGSQFIRKGATIWVAEGEFDTMYYDQSFRQLRAENHFGGGLGGKTLHPKAIRELIALEPKRIMLSLDNDAAGIEYTAKAKQQLTMFNVSCVKYPIGVKDPNQMSLTQISNMIKEYTT